MLVNLFFILFVAFVGGFLARLLRLPSMVGYIVAGIVGGLISSFDSNVTSNIAEIGVMLLLFSVGLELSIEKLVNVGRVAIVGGILQMFFVTSILFCAFVTLFNIPPAEALVLSFSFSLSSTAIIVKLLHDSGEERTIGSQILIAWALVQDLAVIPMVVLLPTLSLQNMGTSWAHVAMGSLLTTLFVLSVVFFVGRMIFPHIARMVASNNQEFLILLAATFAFGVASIVGLFGVTSAFGAFLAGLVISNTQEKHAIFSETRPLRDIFSILFFVTLGFLVSPSFLLAHLFPIIFLTAVVLVIKILVVFLLCEFFDYRGRTALWVSFGLSEVGEFAFVLMILGKRMGVVSDDLAQIGVSTTILSLLAAPFLFRWVYPISVWLKRVTAGTFLADLFSHGNLGKKLSEELVSGHVIVAGYGRMGRWIGKALSEIGLDFVVIDYNHRVVRETNRSGVKAIYGDASFPEILEEAGIRNAKAILVTVPDIHSQEEIIKYVQNNFPEVKIMARAHLDSDIKVLGNYKLEKIVQPEFEAALAVVKKILESRGSDKEQIKKKIKALRLSHASL